MNSILPCFIAVEKAVGSSPSAQASPGSSLAATAEATDYCRTEAD